MKEVISLDIENILREPPQMKMTYGHFYGVKFLCFLMPNKIELPMTSSLPSLF